MSSHASVEKNAQSARVSWLNDPKIRGIVYQVVLAAVLIAFIWWIVGNTIDNLRARGISSGFAFLDRRAGFDISQALITFSADSTFARALTVGFINTVLVAIIGIFTATILGFLVGIGRLSKNWLIAKICTVYVELFRNLPPLLVIFFWYLGVLSALPAVRDSYDMPLGTFLNSRGFFIPRPMFGEGAWLIPAALVVALAISVFVARKAYKRQMDTGQRFPVFRTALALIIGLPLLAYFAAGSPITLDYPVLGTFNLRGGMDVKPEFLSLYLALSFYTASFIAEIVRAGILGVSGGQTEAAYSLGVKPSHTLRLVVVPQALRIIIPPLTSQYLNLTKNSSLAVFIGYPDLVQIGQTTMNQTGQAIEVVAIWMVIYLGLSLATSAFMNWYNAKMALVER
jgi:general L-amino acid transport system permease protein